MKNAEHETQNWKLRTHGGYHRGQVSTELLVIIGAILVIFIPLIATGYLKAAQANEELTISQSRLAVGRIANTIDAVGNLGENSSAMLEIFVPNGVNSIKFSNIGTGSEIVFSLNSQSGSNELAETTRFQVSGSGFEINKPSQGTVRLMIISRGKEGIEVKRV